MKKNFFLGLCLACVLFLVSCAGKKSETKTDTPANTENTTVIATGNPVGTYSAVENGKPMQFVLIADGTGYENYQGTEKRPFKWVKKDSKIFFTYDGEAQEWELPVDIEKGEIQYGSLVYKKE